MADHIVFDYTEMQTAVKSINKISGEYKQEAATFLTSMDKAMDGWEGDSKIKFAELISGPVKNHMENTIPNLIAKLGSLLDSNAQSMQNADAEIASKIPDSL